MFKGTLSAIYYAGESSEPMTSKESVVVEAGRGILGDRYAEASSAKSKPENQITLIEAEAIEAVPREYGFEITALETRRNLVTCGVPLNHLVGREFCVGAVRMRGILLCEPCAHLAKLTGKKVVKALRHRGGLRAEVLDDGEIRVGETITLAGGEADSTSAG